MNLRCSSFYFQDRSNGLRIEGMELYFQAVSIDFGSIFKGKVQLRQPVKGISDTLFLFLHVYELFRDRTVNNSLLFQD